MDVVQRSLALFQPPLIDNCIQKEHWIEFLPVGSVSSQSAVEFHVPGTSMDYIDLKKTKLNIKFKITQEDGKDLNYVTDGSGIPTADSDQVGPINFPLNTIFRQVDVALNQVILSAQVGVNHGYKSILDMLLQSNSDMSNSLAQGSLFFKDTAGDMEDHRLTGNNKGFNIRASHTKRGNVGTMEGVIFNDFMMDQSRLLLNGVSLNIKLFQANDNFRLLTPLDKSYKLVITNAILKVCQVSVHPAMILAHDQALSRSPAVYPFWRSDVKSFTISPGSQTFMIDNIYHGHVPSKIILGFVLNEAYSGNIKLNPFNFIHQNVNNLEVTVDGVPVPHRPLKPDFANNDYLPSYLSLMDSDYDVNSGIIISSEDYPNGYSLFLFDLQSYLNTDIMSKPIKGHVRISLNFASPLTSSINAIVYAKFPDIIAIDQSRNVSLGYSQKNVIEE